MALTNQLDKDTHELIMQLSEVGNICIANDDYEGAIKHFRAAFELVPSPFEDWEASIWLLTSLGEAYFFNGEHHQSYAALAKAMHVPGAIGNSLIHLRLGQVQLELGNTKRATDELLRAYMNEGREVFDGEDQKYFQFLQSAVPLL
jgi:tetratricopeptide (TPR) repeat protein